MAAKVVHPLTSGPPADDHTPIGEEVLDIGLAHRETMVDPDGISDDFTGKREPFRRGMKDDIFITNA